MILSNYVRSPLPAPLPPLGQTSREGADPLWPHPCDDDRRLAVAVALTGVVIKQSLLEMASGAVLYRKVIDCSTAAGSRD